VSWPHSHQPVRPTTVRRRCTGSTTRPAWRIGESVRFHTEIGYWFWDAEHELVMRALITPRGIMVLAGGTARSGATALTVSANAGEEDFGILSNPHLRPTADTTQFPNDGRPLGARRVLLRPSDLHVPTPQRRSVLPSRPEHAHAHQVAAADPRRARSPRQPRHRRSNRPRLAYRTSAYSDDPLLLLTRGVRGVLIALSRTP
jgi:hypothetical protein